MYLAYTVHIEHINCLLCVDDNKFPIFAMTLISKVKVNYTLHLFMVRSAQISLIFPPAVFKIFCTMIVNVV